MKAKTKRTTPFTGHRKDKDAVMAGSFVHLVGSMTSPSARVLLARNLVRWDGHKWMLTGLGVDVLRHLGVIAARSTE